MREWRINLSKPQQKELLKLEGKLNKLDAKREPILERIRQLMNNAKVNRARQRKAQGSRE